MTALSVGEVGVPLIDVLVADFSFAEDEGIGSQLWAGVGFAGSSGGALRLFFGTEDIGYECNTSCFMISSVMPEDRHVATHPARLGIQESPPNTILQYVLHLATSVEEHSQHSFPQVDDIGVLLCFSWM
jgi:hypothetical protein